MKTIYVVYGTTGEYSDYSMWDVAAFSTRKAAQDYATKCRLAVQQLDNSRGENIWDQRNAQEQVMRETLDAGCRIDYTGTDYGVAKLTLDPKGFKWLGKNS